MYITSKSPVLSKKFVVKEYRDLDLYDSNAAYMIAFSGELVEKN